MRLDAWVKDIAPSTELRKWFHHNQERWPEFCKRYKAELKNPKLQKTIFDTLQAARKHSTITLIYAAKDTERSCFRQSSKGELANDNSRFSR